MMIKSVTTPLLVALKGKGPATLVKRIGSIGKRYGLNTGKMDRALERLSGLLHAYGCKATLPITTVALARNSAVIQKYQAQGIEFAIHGYLHVDHTELSVTQQCDHFQKATQIFQDSGIDFQGFRCPYLRWNNDTLTALSKLPFTYDSSPGLVWNIPHKNITDSYERAMEFYGAQPVTDYLALPYLDSSTNLVRIPYSLPDDESLIERLEWSSLAEMNAIWPSMFHQAHRQGELFTLGLHPERTFDCAEALTATLAEVEAAGSAVWSARLDEIAAWWKARSEAKIEKNQLQPDLLQLAVDGPDGATLLLRSLEVKTAAEPGLGKYRRATEMPCLVQTELRPFIGVSTESDPALLDFLTQQGYIVEQTTQPELYSHYLDIRTFSPAEQRALVEEIEAADYPLAKLSRWPNGAQSAFNVTGDIDALTVWDYSLRLWSR